MNINTLIHSTLDALRSTGLPAHRSYHRPTDIIEHQGPQSWGSSYLHRFTLKSPLGAPDGTPVRLTRRNHDGTLTNIQGVVVDSAGESVDIEAFGVPMGESSLVSIHALNGSVEKAVVHHLTRMLEPQGIANHDLVSNMIHPPPAALSGLERDRESAVQDIDELQRLRDACSSSGVEPTHGEDPANARKQFIFDCLQPDPLPGFTRAAELPRCYTASSTAVEKARNHLPADYDEVGQLLAQSTNKPVLFVQAAPDTAAAEYVAGDVQKFVEQQLTVLVLGRHNRDVNGTAEVWQRSASAENCAAVRVGTGMWCDVSTIPMAWEECGRQHQDLDMQLKQIGQEISALADRPFYSKLSPADADRQKALIAERESLIQRLQAEATETIRCAQVVFANTASALLCPGIMGRTFDAVIVTDSHLLSVPELLVFASLATKAIRIVGNCRHYAEPVSRQRTLEHNFVHTDVFEFCGVTQNMDIGLYDPRLVFLRIRRNTNPDITSVISGVAYGGLLLNEKIEDRTSLTDDQPAGPDIELWDTSSLQTTTLAFDNGESHFNPASAALSLLAMGCPLPEYDNEAHTCVIITPYPKQRELIEAAIRDRELDVEVTTLDRPLRKAPYLAIIDLTDSSGVKSPGWKLSGSMRGHSLRWLTTALSSGRKKVVVLADLAFLEQTLPQNAALRVYLDQIKRVCGPAKLFPMHLLEPPLTLEQPDCSAFVNEEAAWNTLYHDIAKAQLRVIHYWPRSVEEIFKGTDADRLLIRGDGLEQLIVADPDIHTLRKLARQGVRVIKPRISERSCFLDPDCGLVQEVRRSPLEGSRVWLEDPRHFDRPAVLIDRNLIWLVGAGPGHPYVRIKGQTTVRLLAEYLGLDYLHCPPAPSEHRSAGQ